MSNHLDICKKRASMKIRSREYRRAIWHKTKDRLSNKESEIAADDSAQTENELPVGQMNYSTLEAEATYYI